MKRKLGIISIILSVLILFSTVSFVFSENEMDDEKYNLSEELIEKYLTPCQPESIFFKSGARIVFYDEYEDNENALMAFRIKYRDLYSQMKNLSRKDINLFEDWQDGHDEYMYACRTLVDTGKITEADYYDAVRFVGRYFHPYMNELIRNAKTIDELKRNISTKYADELNSLSSQEFQEFNKFSD